ncbi:MAG: bifunctional hydroxymethylpyrimidine kinase/phosphomethylpyrimidine kinase [Solirubrobacterales bacterium]
MASSGTVPVALTIAGSDSGGGAGIQADLKAFAAAGVHGTAAITAITAQNTVGVDAVQAIDPAIIVAQVAAVASDIGVGAAKTGMLGTVETIQAVVDGLEHLPGVPLVVDPVMVAESGAVLLADDAREVLIERLLPRATVATPNVPEALALTGLPEETTLPDLAHAVLDLGPQAVVVTGGHRDRADDTFVDAAGTETIGGVRHPDGAAHGSGCTHSATLAARLARGDSARLAARAAREAAGRAIDNALREIGAGVGPVDILGVAAR